MLNEWNFKDPSSEQRQKGKEWLQRRYCSRPSFSVFNIEDSFQQLETLEQLNATPNEASLRGQEAEGMILRPGTRRYPRVTDSCFPEKYIGKISNKSAIFESHKL